MLRIRASIVCLSIVLVASVVAHADKFHTKPYLQNVAGDGATIMWETEETGPGMVEYGLKGSFDQKASGAADEQIHKVRLKGLKPDTAYSYRVHAGSEIYENSFKSSPGANNNREVTFIVIGDTRRWGNSVEETHLLDHIKQWNGEFIIINGDLTPTGHNKETWPEHFKRFESISGGLMIAPARGNHEGSMINDKENDWFAKYHDLPGDGEPYASFDWGNVHLVLISWEQSSRPDLMKTTAEWLDKHFTDVHAKYTFVCQHYPIYCTGYFSPSDDRKEPSDVMRYLRLVFEKHNLTADTSGHTHIFERIYPMRDGKRDDRNGVHYLVNGGDIGGNYPDSWTAVSDDRATMEKPTYTVYQCKNDRMIVKTFCWSKGQKAFEQIDHEIIWKDEAVPKASLAALKTKKGAELIQAMDDLSAMLYAPAAKLLVPFLKDKDVKTCQAAAKALALLGNEGVAADLMPYLTDPDLTARRYAARSLEVAMPESLAGDVAKQAQDASQDPATRIKLIGALQFHAPAALARDTATAILNTDAPKEVRQRAAYALGRVATKEDAEALTALYSKEPDTYCTMRFAFVLNKLTGNQQSFRENSPVISSKPGERSEFVAKWLGK